MVKKKEKSGTDWLPALSLLFLPGAGLVLLVLGIICILILLGLFIGLYLILQTYHAVTAVVFAVLTTMLLWLGVKSEIITDETSEKYPWMWLLIPGAFFIGYVAEVSQSLCIQPLTVASEQTGGSFVMVLLLFFAALFILKEFVEGTK